MDNLQLKWWISLQQLCSLIIKYKNCSCKLDPLELCVWPNLPLAAKVQRRPWTRLTLHVFILHWQQITRDNSISTAHHKRRQISQTEYSHHFLFRQMTKGEKLCWRSGGCWLHLRMRECFVAAKHDADPQGVRGWISEKEKNVTAETERR